jgi:hypothetical protein
MVLRTEDLDARYGDILAFLGLPPAPAPGERHTRRATGAPPLDPALRARLDATFAADQAELGAYL